MLALFRQAGESLTNLTFSFSRSVFTSEPASASQVDLQLRREKARDYLEALLTAEREDPLIREVMRMVGCHQLIAPYLGVHIESEFRSDSSLYLTEKGFRIVQDDSTSRLTVDRLVPFIDLLSDRPDFQQKASSHLSETFAGVSTKEIREKGRAVYSNLCSLERAHGPVRQFMRSLIQAESFVCLNSLAGMSGDQLWLTKNGFMVDHQRISPRNLTQFYLDLPRERQQLEELVLKQAETRHLLPR